MVNAAQSVNHGLPYVCRVCECVCRYGGMLGFAITATVIAFFGFTGFLGK